MHTPMETNESMRAKTTKAQPDIVICEIPCTPTRQWGNEDCNLVEVERVGPLLVQYIILFRYRGLRNEISELKL